MPSHQTGNFSYYGECAGVIIMDRQTRASKVCGNAIQIHQFKRVIKTKIAHYAIISLIIKVHR